MGAQLEIVLVEPGGTPATEPQAGAPPQSRQRAESPRPESASGPRRESVEQAAGGRAASSASREDDRTRVARDALADVAQVIGRALGITELMAAIGDLADVLRGVARSTSLVRTERVSTTRQAATSGGGEVARRPSMALPVPPRAPAATTGAAVEAAAATAAVPAAGAAAEAGAASGARAATALGAVSVAAGAVVAGLVAIVAAAVVVGVALKLLASKIREQVDALASFSPQVAMAQAESEIRMTRAEMRRAETIGPQLAMAERVRSRAEEALYDLGTQVLNWLLRTLEPLLPIIERGIGFLELISASIELLLAKAEELIDFTEGRWDELDKDRKETRKAWDKMQQAMKHIAEGLEQEKEPEIDPFLEQFMASAVPLGIPATKIPRRAAGG